MTRKINLGSAVYVWKSRISLDANNTDMYQAGEHARPTAAALRFQMFCLICLRKGFSSEVLERRRVAPASLPMKLRAGCAVIFEYHL